MRGPLPGAVTFATLVLAGPAGAQTFAERLEVAEREVFAKQWVAALPLLLPLCDEVDDDPYREVLANDLHLVGMGLLGERKAAPALQAHEAALALRRARAGDDDELVAQSLNSVASCLSRLGREQDALTQNEAALTIRRRVFEGTDHPALAQSLANVAVSLQRVGRSAAALPLLEEVLAMQGRLHADQDHAYVAIGLNNLAACLWSLGRAEEAMGYHEQAFVMRRRLYGDKDHPELVNGLANIAQCLVSLGRSREALAKAEAALEMGERLAGGRPDPNVVLAHNAVANALRSLGRSTEALQQYDAIAVILDKALGKADHPDVLQNHGNRAACLMDLGQLPEALAANEAALAMASRMYPGRDTPDAARLLNNIAVCLHHLGRNDQALPRFEAARDMELRLHGGRDHREVAYAMASAAGCLMGLGRAADAESQFAAALAMHRRLQGDKDHADVALALNDHAGCLQVLGRAGEALPEFEAALSMRQRLHDDGDHPDIALTLNNVGYCLRALDRPADALRSYEAALAMRERLCAGRDHPELAKVLNNLGSCLSATGHPGGALEHHRKALAMRERLFGAADHPDVRQSLDAIAGCLQALGRADEGLPFSERAVAMIERLRDDSLLSPGLRQSYFDELKGGGAFERLQALTAALAQPAASWQAAERSRGRGLLDLIGEHRFDALGEAEHRARQRGDDDTATRLGALRIRLSTEQLERDRLLHELTRLDDKGLDDGDRQQHRADLLVRSNAVTKELRQTLDERARLLGDVLPIGNVRTAADVQAVLLEGELLLLYTLAPSVEMLYVLGHDGSADAVPLPGACATVERVLPQVLAAVSQHQLAARGRDPEDGVGAVAASDDALHELFAKLVPTAVWQRIRTEQRVFVAAHRELHRLPFELLVTRQAESKAVHWLDEGPAVAYVPSGSVLHWLRRRAAAASDDTTSLDLLAVGDPASDVGAEVPERGAYVLAVDATGAGASAGLLPGDVLVRYDGTDLADDRSLRDERMRVEVAVDDGARKPEPVPVEIWRRGNTLQLKVTPGTLGVQIGRGGARAAWEAARSEGLGARSVTRSGEIERIGKLPPLMGARAETEAIAEVFAQRDGKTARLVGAEASEPAVFDLAAKAKYLHFACHGIAEEYAGQSLSTLVLSQPQQVLPGDDGLLALDDLLSNWRGRLSSCRLVVLSACRTNVGRTLRDEAPQALPIGFLFAGAPAVISSLWAVDDASTKELMTDFYGRLLAGETDKLAAFTAARKALRAKYPDPFHWAPFLYLGAPE